VIIEYPTLHVVLKGSSNDMKILHQGKCNIIPTMLRIATETEAVTGLPLFLYGFVFLVYLETFKKCSYS
jgi:hypothetical protein